MDMTRDRASETGIHVDRSEVLYKMSNPDIYKINAFRVLGLPVTASPKEISAHGRKLDLVEKFGGEAHAHSLILPLSPPPDGDARQTAHQRLKVPELRFIDEFFWFWPLAPNLPEGKDEAIAAMGRGDLPSARSIWERHEIEGSEANVSMHNLAVLHHIHALDLERLEVVRTPTEEQIQEKRSHWERAFTRWHALLKDEGFWERVRERIRELDDPRLKTGTVRRIREGLPTALLSINALLAVEAAEMNDPEDAVYHLRLMRHPSFSEADIQEALHRSVVPTRDRLKAISAHAAEECGKEPENDYTLARDLMDRASPLLQILDLMLPEGNASRESAHDEVALQARSCTISCCNQTESWHEALGLTKRVAEIAESQSVREGLQEDLGIIKRAARYSRCWFCNSAPADETSMVAVKMHGNVQRVGTQVTYQRFDVPVPRCGECKSAHDQRALLTYGGMALGIILAIAVGVPTGNAAAGFFVFIASGIIGFAAAQLTFPKVVQQEAHKNKFPAVLEMGSQGWGIGEKPEGVQ